MAAAILPDNDTSDPSAVTDTERSNEPSNKADCHKRLKQVCSLHLENGNQRCQHLYDVVISNEGMLQAADDGTVFASPHRA